MTLTGVPSQATLHSHTEPCAEPARLDGGEDVRRSSCNVKRRRLDQSSPCRLCGRTKRIDYLADKCVVTSRWVAPINRVADGLLAQRCPRRLICCLKGFDIVKGVHEWQVRGVVKPLIARQRDLTLEGDIWRIGRKIEDAPIRWCVEREGSCRRGNQTRERPVACSWKVYLAPARSVFAKMTKLVKLTPVEQMVGSDKSTTAVGSVLKRLHKYARGSELLSAPPAPSCSRAFALGLNTPPVNAVLGVMMNAVGGSPGSTLSTTCQRGSRRRERSEMTDMSTTRDLRWMRACARHQRLFRCSQTCLRSSR